MRFADWGSPLTQELAEWLAAAPSGSYREAVARVQGRAMPLAVVTLRELVGANMRSLSRESLDGFAYALSAALEAW